MADAIRLLGVERVDHGIRALEDPALVAVMADSRLPITFCPLSNLRLQVYKGQLEERVREVLASGIKVTINSDDPAYFGRWVTPLGTLKVQQLEVALADWEGAVLCSPSLHCSHNLCPAWLATPLALSIPWYLCSPQLPYLAPSTPPPLSATSTATTSGWRAWQGWAPMTWLRWR